MSALVVVVTFGLLVIVPMWKAVISALLLDRDPEKWEKWQERESERRKRRDEKLAKATRAAMEGARWAAEGWKKWRGRSDDDRTPG